MSISIAIASNSIPNLEKLQIGYNQISDEGASRIGRAIGLKAIPNL